MLPQLHLLRGKGAFQEENIPLPNMRNACQARDVIYSDVGRRSMREGYQLEETYIENVSGGGLNIVASLRMDLTDVFSPTISKDSTRQRRIFRPLWNTIII